jgi:DNA-binding transcriptional LysR family regulator
LAIGAAEFVLSDHLPAILEKVRKTQPEFRLSLRSGYQAQFEEWLLAHEIDLAITPVERKPPARIKRFPLVSLTLSLLVPKASKLRDAKELFAKDVLREPLISLPPTETVSLLFQTELKRRKIDWLPSIEASSLAVLNRYVENGYGIGLSLMMPGTGVPKELRALPLPEFPRLAVQALWHEDCSPLLQSVLEELKRHAARLASLAGEGR